MQIIYPCFKIESLPDADLAEQQIELAARTCYKSENMISTGSAQKLIEMCIRRGHESVLEHVTISILIVCDRGISHEIVRHRLASFSQESTRYANYSKEKFGREITVIRPFFWPENSIEYRLWLQAVEKSEAVYLALLDAGSTPQQARSVLPNSLKTEIVITANIRQWGHILRLRCSDAAHPQVKQVMIPILCRLQRWSKTLFGDIEFGSGWRDIPMAQEIYNAGLLDHEWDASREVSEMWSMGGDI